MAKSLSKDKILDAIRNLAKELNRTPSLAEFQRKTKISQSNVTKYFSGWREAVQIAGLKPHTKNIRIDDTDLLQDWGLYVRRIKGIPTRDQYRRGGKYNPGTLEKRFGMWSLIPIKFKEYAKNKLNWEDVLSIISTQETKIPKKQITSNSRIALHPYAEFVDSSRLNELRAISNNKFDLKKLIRFCEELNECYKNENYLAVAMLVRAILDHVPPIFGKEKFSEVANNYGGSKSFKESMQHLENSSRKIADAHLHNQIRPKEVLPNKTQINFTNDLDVLFSEIVRQLN